MAVGDIVNNVGAVNTLLTFQPAVGVSILITSSGGNSNTVRITNGVVTSLVGNATLASNFLSNYKLFINNTNYLYIDPVATYGCFYSGIQVQ